MIKFSLLDIFKNLIILIPFLRYFSQLFHKTGIQNDKEIVNNRLYQLSNIIKSLKINDLTVMEIGPGQTYDVITSLTKHPGVSNAYAVDIRRYFSDNFWTNKGVRFLYKSTQSLQTGSINFIYCYDVLEHVKDPNYLLSELRRLISESGLVFLSWDLRDHFYLDSESNWFEMHKYSKFIWELQMSNRSSYVNRLLYQDWIDLFEFSKFKINMIDTLNSNIAANHYYDLYHVRIDPTYRVKAILSPI